MDTKALNNRPVTNSATRKVAADDLQRGDYVAITQTTYQLVPWGETSWGGELTPQTIRLIPPDSGETFRVLTICLPFVFTIVASGGHQTLDLRRHTLRRLDPAFGKQAFHAQRDKDDDKKSRKPRKSRKKRRKQKRKEK